MRFVNFVWDFVEMETSFETNRLLLEKLSSTDDDFIFEVVNTKGWRDFIGDRNVKSKEDASAYVQKIKDNQNITYWTVKLKENKKAIGVITLLKRDYLNHTDIGFAFLPQFSSRGYAYEATKFTLCNILKADHTFILATSIPENKNSIKLLRKLGFQFQKEIKPHTEILHVYSISKQHFIRGLEKEGR